MFDLYTYTFALTTISRWDGIVHRQERKTLCFLGRDGVLEAWRPFGLGVGGGSIVPMTTRYLGSIDNNSGCESLWAT